MQEWSCNWRPWSNLLTGTAQSVNTQFDHIPRGEKNRRVFAQTHAGRRSRGDQVSGQQGHKLTDIRYQEGDIKNHLSRGAILHHFAIYFEPEPEMADIR